jgi:tRNA 2-selenouridine synthase
MHANITDLQSLFIADVPLMDVRAPIEFHKGAFPNAVNLPLMSDDERHRVGICYKQQGPDKALALGHRLVSGAIKADRLAAWIDFTRAHPQGVLYCFRGGQRSAIVQQWLLAESVHYPRVAGGYKAMRSFLVETLDAAAAQCRYTILGGLTGSGKTEVLTRLTHGVDLEGLANHRGSSFGKRLTPQPAQVYFENALAIHLLRLRHAGIGHIVLEDEGRFIGSCSLPLALHQQVRSSPLVWLDEPLTARVTRILDDYVVDLYTALSAQLDQDQAWAALSDRLQHSLASIARRLGMERYRRLSALMCGALDHHQRHGDPSRHRDWITALLAEYYDPMYASQRDAYGQRLVFRGTRAEVQEYLSASRAA